LFRPSPPPPAVVDVGAAVEEASAGIVAILQLTMFDEGCCLDDGRRGKEANTSLLLFSTECPCGVVNADTKAVLQLLLEQDMEAKVKVRLAEAKIDAPRRTIILLLMFSRQILPSSPDDVKLCKVERGRAVFV